MEIKRPKYLGKLVSKRENGLVKVITGIRRSGKSYLLNTLFKKYLLQSGVPSEQIIQLALDQDKNVKYRNPLLLGEYIRSLTADKKKMYYVFLDEIQKVSAIPNPYLSDSDDRITFVDTLLGLMDEGNVDLYVTGSNSKMLSSDILTSFRDRGDEIKMNPLSYAEFFEAYKDDRNHAYREYWTYGGMPFLLKLTSHEDKADYLKKLIAKTYISDVIERYHVRKESQILDDLLNYSASSIGSYISIRKLENTFLSEGGQNISQNTIKQYLDYFEDCFLVKKAIKYDIKGRKYIGSRQKYYFADIGLRNAQLNFRQMEESHCMENIIFNELITRGFSTDIGGVETFQKDSKGKTIRKELEVDFIANNAGKRYYIQSALHLDTEQKKEQELNSLLKIDDSFKKIVVVKDDIIPWNDDKGIMYIGIEQFLLDEKAINM